MRFQSGQYRKRTTQFASTVCLISLCGQLYAAPVVPDAGQTMREVQKQPEVPAPSGAVPLNVEGNGVRKAAPQSDVRLVVKAIRVTGNKVFSANELEPLLGGLVGGERTLAELNVGVARITKFYRDRGYAVARAYLPAQDIQEGMIVVTVLEGVIGEQRLINQSRISDSQVNSYMSGVKTGEALESDKVNRALLILKDTPGVGGMRASLQPGASVGTTDLLVELDPSVPYSSNLEFDNYGNRYTGEYRLGGALILNSPIHKGDQLNMRLMASNGSMSYARAAYQMPVGGDGFNLGVAYADTRYKLGKEFTALQAHGGATSSSLYASYPLVRKQYSSVFTTLMWEKKALVDKTDMPASSVEKDVHLVTLGLAANHQDSALGGGVTMFDASWVSGKLNMDAASSTLDNATAKSGGTFSKLSYRANRTQRLMRDITGMLIISGQQARKNLNSSEKFSLGGASGVRAYPQGEGSGDQGWMVNVEVRHGLQNNLQWSIFYDEGAVAVNHTPYTAITNTRKISGAGLGLNGQYSSIQLKASIAWRNKGGVPESEPASASRNPRIFIQVAGGF